MISDPSTTFRPVERRTSESVGDDATVFGRTYIERHPIAHVAAMLAVFACAAGFGVLVSVCLTGGAS